jgi:PAS domain S-box-containing protein
MKDKDRKKSGQTQVFIHGKKFWEMTFNAVPDAIAIIDRNYQIVQINKAMAERLGMAPEQCNSLSCYRVIHGLDAPPPICPHSRLLKDGSEQREEVHEQRLGGTFIVSVSPLLDETGQLYGSVHVAHDITERKQMEENLLSLNRELQETNKNLQAAYQWMRDSRDLLRKSCYEEGLGFLVDHEGRIEWISEKVIEYTGKSRNELIACNIVDLFQPSCRDHLKYAMKQAWIGIINPIMVEIIFARLEERIFEAKFSRLTSCEQRRLWVSLEYCSPNPGEGIDT